VDIGELQITLNAGEDELDEVIRQALLGEPASCPDHPCLNAKPCRADTLSSEIDTRYYATSNLDSSLSYYHRVHQPSCLIPCTSCGYSRAPWITLVLPNSRILLIATLRIIIPPSPKEFTEPT
jgi:hypothetical protein